MSKPNASDIASFAIELSEIINADRGDLEPGKVEFQSGPKYVRVVVSHPGSCSSSAYAFIDRENGNLYMPAGWKSPTKNVVRGNITNGTWRAWCGKYGINHAR